MTVLGNCGPSVANNTLDQAVTETHEPNSPGMYFCMHNYLVESVGDLLLEIVTLAKHKQIHLEAQYALIFRQNNF